ncbi:MAG: BTAD domain-containing putative transcriptional regulator [Dermatophilaceae bacterium]
MPRQSRVAAGGPGLASIRPRLLLRPRLLDVLTGRFERRVTAVVAGAGFGKTSLLRQATDENRLTPGGADVWLRCTPEHDAVSVLTQDLLAALELPGRGLETLPAERPTEVGVASRVLAEAVWARAPQHVCLVLDDVHVLAATGGGRRALADLVDRLPANGHLLVSSRPPNPLPIARLLAAGDATLVGEDELAFTDPELDVFAAQRGVLRELLGDLGGWPALAELVATTGHRPVHDFIWEEIVERLPEQTCQVLGFLARVGGADDQLASDALGRSVDLAAELRDLPLVSVDREGWWMVHQLWASALRERGSRGAPDPDSGEAARSVARLLDARGHVRQAVRLLLDSGEWDEARPLIVRTCAGIAPEVGSDVLLGWYDSLHPQQRASPEGHLLVASARMNEGPEAKTGHLLESAAGFRQAGDVAGEMACLVSIFHAGFWVQDPVLMGMAQARWRVLAADGVPEAAALTALGRALQGRDAAAVRLELEALPRTVEGPTTILLEWLRAHLLLLTLGDAQAAVTWAHRVLPRAPRTLRSSIRCELVEALRLLGRVDEALAEASALADDVATSVVRSPRHELVLLVLYAFRGDIPAARARAEHLQAAVDVSAAWWAPLAEAVGAAALAVAIGDEDLARARLAALRAQPRAYVLAALRISPAVIPLEYVLDERWRQMWDEADLSGQLAVALRLARAVVTVRDGGRLTERLSDSDLAVASPVLPVPWATELAVALDAAGDPRSEVVLSALGANARAVLRAIDDQRRPGARNARRLLSLMPRRPSGALVIRVLGPLTLLRDGVDVVDADLRRERVRRLLGLLAVRRSVTRHGAAALMWPDLPDADAARNLRVTLNYLRRVLEPDRDDRDPPYYLRGAGSTIELAGEGLEVDLWAFREHIETAERAEARRLPSVSLEANLRAVDSYAGDLLADLSGEDLDRDRDLLRRQFVGAALRAGNLLLALGDTTRPEELAERALSVEPWSEQAYQLLAGVLLDRDDRAGARRVLDRGFDMLSELGLGASVATVDLSDRVRAGQRRPRIPR